MINDLSNKRHARGKGLSKADGLSRVQYGALPFRFNKAGSLELLLVTTRQTKRWIIPKGWPAKGMKPAKSAAREAYEEAGIRGAIGRKSIGAFFYEKRLEESDSTIACEVRVFPMNVKRRLKTWPEAHERDARWFEPRDALSALGDEGLRDLIAAFVAKTMGQRQLTA
jgi:8-oxo-dGTP pyrophosphatase MutT (NUDIX family)